VDRLLNYFSIRAAIDNIDVELPSEDPVNMFQPDCMFVVVVESLVVVVIGQEKFIDSLIKVRIYN
jgi:hypothetical protein